MIPRPLAVLDFLDPFLGVAYGPLGLHSRGEKDLLKILLLAILSLTAVVWIQTAVRSRREEKERALKGERKYSRSKAAHEAIPFEPDEKRAFADALLERGEHLQAGRIFEELNQPSSAAIAYKKGRHWLELAQMYDRYKNYLPAAQAFQMAERPREAAMAFVKGNDFLHAGEMFLKIEYFDKAGQAFEKAGKLVDAATAYERWYLTVTNPGDEGLGVLQRAGMLYAQSGQLEKAVPLLERAGAFVEAGRVCAQMNNYRRAADLLLRAGRRKEALEALRRVGEKEEILRLEAEILATEGSYEEAAKRFRLLKDNYEAAELFRKAGRFPEAAEQYETGGYFLEAAESFENARNLEHAQALYVRAGRPSQAAGLLVRLGRHREGAELYEKADEPVLAAQVYLNSGTRKQALEILTKLPRSHHQYKLGAPLLGHMLTEAGDYIQAKALLGDFLTGQPVNEDTRGPYLDLARCHEGLGERTAYLENLYRIQGLDPEDLDIRSRIEKCKTDLVKEGSPRPTPPGIILGPADGESFDLPPGLAKADLPNRYEVIEQLGAGGMGEVYKAKDLVLDRPVAIKFLRNLSHVSSQAARFMREARAAARFNHPNIVTVYDVGVFEGTAFIVMEYVEGETLRALIARVERVPVAQTLSIAQQVTTALATAHAVGLIHRDIKPDNILLNARGEAKLTDFGIVHIQEQGITGPGMAIGTVRYMSPEQIQGDPIDGRADLYALGVTLYEMLTGTAPFTKGDVSYQHVHQPPPAPHEKNPGVPPEVESVVLKLLAKDPGDRYPSAEALKIDLTEILNRLGS